MEKTKIKLNIMKKYNTQRNVGKAKYVINYHDGVKKHSDGSDFYDIQITSNKVCFNAFIKYLQNIGYTEQQRIENDKTLSPEQKEKAKIESTAKALEGLKEFKAESDRYFEYVPIEEIEKYKEFDRATEKKWGSADNTLKELVADIQKNGIKTPITLQVDINNNALVVEGNTRLAAAKKLGIKNIPVRIISGEFGSINKDKTKKLGRKRDIGEMSVFYPYVNILNQKNSPAKFGFTSITNTKNISEAYHADKAAGKETESVKDVLGTPNIQQGKISPTNTTTEFLPKEAVPNVEDWSREQQRIENDKTQLPNIKQCEQKLIFKSIFNKKKQKMASTKVCNKLRELVRSYNNTSFYNDGMTDGIILHDTLIFKIDRSSRIITLNTGGWNTPTTRRRINEAFIASGLAGWFVYQKKGELYFSKSYDNPDKNGYVFEDKIAIAY